MSSGVIFRIFSGLTLWGVAGSLILLGCGKDASAQGQDLGRLSVVQLQAQDLQTNHRVEVSFRGVELKATVVVFVSSRCPCSHNHVGALNALYRNYHAKGVSFLGVHANADQNDTSDRAYFSRRPFEFRVIRDPGLLVAQLGALKTPHAFVLSPTGQVLFRGGGGRQ